MMNGCRWDIEDYLVPLSSDLVKHLLLVVGNIRPIQVVVHSKLVILVRTRSEASSHLHDKYFRNSCMKECEMFETTLHALIE